MQKNLKHLYINNKIPRAFFSSLIFFGVAYGLYHGIQDNFLAEIVSIKQFQRGLVEFFRELPGLFLIGILAFMFRFSDEKIFKVGNTISILGLLLLSFIQPKLHFIIIGMVLFSIGEHILLSTRSVLTINLSHEKVNGAALGITNSLSSIGKIAGYFIVVLLFPLFDNLFSALVSFRLILIISTICLILASISSYFLKDSPKKRPVKLYFRKKYTKYYMLELFYGARKQVFLTFAPFTIILYYDANVSLISFLLAISSIVSIVVSPLIGRLVDKLGYRKVMIWDTIILFFVCVLYGYSHILFAKNIALIVVCINYIFDTVLSACSMAANVYARDLSDDKDELSATLSTGVSVNHIVSVGIALLGGYIWATLGLEVLFTISGVLGLINSVYAASIKKPQIAN